MFLNGVRAPYRIEHLKDVFIILDGRFLLDFGHVHCFLSFGRCRNVHWLKRLCCKVQVTISNLLLPSVQRSGPLVAGLTDSQGYGYGSLK